MKLGYDYPRPQFVRKNWQSLNGKWEFEFDDTNKGIEEKWYRKERLSSRIIVPFGFQTKLSGINDKNFHDHVWYARDFSIPSNWKGKEIIIHFGAVDYETRIWINGKEIGDHSGGHTSFSFNITKYLKENENRIVLWVEDTQDTDQPRGKQYSNLKPEGCFYDRTTGIWQTVWLEPVPASRIENIKFTPNIDSKEIEIETIISGDLPDEFISLEISFKGKKISRAVVRSDHGICKTTVKIKNMKLWSPEEPNLYDVDVVLVNGKKKLDEVNSYFGMRKISVKGNKILLNNKPYYLKLILDQGYWPDSLITPPSGEALKNDVVFSKMFGFNGCRKHQKIEDQRFLYWADKFGLLVWGEMANAWTFSARAEKMFLKEWPEVIKRDYNHPCIITWVPFNESWGIKEVFQDVRQQEFVKKVVLITKEMDKTRLVIDNDGWDHIETDLVTIHDYSAASADFEKNYAQFKKDKKTFPVPHNKQTYAQGYSYDGKPILFTEYGGIAFKMPDREYGKEDRGYHDTETEENKLVERFRDTTQAIMKMDFCCGFAYTQLTDVQQEINGLLTFDRKTKVDPKKIKKILDTKEDK